MAVLVGVENAATAKSIVPMVGRQVSIPFLEVFLGRLPVEPQQVLGRNLELVRIHRHFPFDSAIAKVW